MASSSVSNKSGKPQDEGRDSKTAASTPQSRQEKGKEPVIKFKSCDATDDLKNTVVALYKKHMDAPTLPRMCEAIKKDLDEQIPKGWVVFAGMHLVGVCSFIQNTMVEFEADGTPFVIFQTFCPS